MSASQLQRNPLGRWVWTDALGLRHEQVVGAGVPRDRP